MPNVFTPRHPLIADAIAKCRDKNTPTPIFRAAVADLGRYLGYEACRDWLPTLHAKVETPLDVEADAEIIDGSASIEIVPILRAGLALVEGVLPLLPNAKILHVGYRRDEETAQAVCYLTRLPHKMPATSRIMILEPMLATGGTVIQVLDAMAERGADISLVRVISLLASEHAIEKIGEKYPQLTIFCAAIDPIIDERFFIVPGLGDAGDRAFGTE